MLQKLELMKIKLEIQLINKNRCEWSIYDVNTDFLVIENSCIKIDFLSKRTMKQIFSTHHR